MKPLAKEFTAVSQELEGIWISRINELESQGMTFGDPEYDLASKNLCAIAGEFWIWDEEQWTLGLFLLLTDCLPCDLDYASIRSNKRPSASTRGCLFPVEVALREATRKASASFCLVWKCLQFPFWSCHSMLMVITALRTKGQFPIEQDHRHDEVLQMHNSQLLAPLTFRSGVRMPLHWNEADRLNMECWGDLSPQRNQRSAGRSESPNTTQEHDASSILPGSPRGHRWWCCCPVYEYESVWGQSVSAVPQLSLQ